MKIHLELDEKLGGVSFSAPDHQGRPFMRNLQSLGWLPIKRDYLKAGTTALQIPAGWSTPMSKILPDQPNWDADRQSLILLHGPGGELMITLDRNSSPCQDSFSQAAKDILNKSAAVKTPQNGTPPADPAP